MTRQWKPGDVAHYDGLRVFLVANRTHGLMWVDQEGDERPIPVDAIDGRLVVIDPEGSRGIAVEIAQRVGSALHVMPGSDISAGIKAVQTVLREFANPAPPKPDEPKGLGAVVEDEHGEKWVFMGQGAEGSIWHRVGHPPRWGQWRDVAAVRVLSEGVA